jgi:hypothetical protein
MKRRIERLRDRQIALGHGIMFHPGSFCSWRQGSAAGIAYCIAMHSSKKNISMFAIANH